MIIVILEINVDLLGWGVSHVTSHGDSLMALTFRSSIE
jgi:hypothetical protein